MDTTTDIDPIDHFIEEMGLLSQRDNGPRIAGRIWGLLLVEGRACGLQEMAERLKVSKASISTNARLLQGTGLIRRVAQPGNRQDYYEITEDPYSQMLKTISAKLLASANQIAAAEKLIPDSHSGAKQRIQTVEQFYRQSSQFMVTWRNSVVPVSETPGDAAPPAPRMIP